MRYPYLILIVVISLLCPSISLWAQEDSTMLRLQKQAFPQEKIHLMTDAECYMPGDTVWMRLWIQDGETLKDSEVGSRYAYVELRDRHDSLHHRIKIEEREGRFVGQMILPKTIQTGSYTMVAYTMYMLGTSFNTYFKKPISILTANDARHGTVPKLLYSHDRNYSEYLPTTHVIRRADTLTRVTIPVPESTWLAISVTDDRYSPVNPSYNIEHRLPRVPDLFTLSSVARQPEIVTPIYPVEVRPLIYGRSLKTRRTKFIPQPSTMVVMADAYQGNIFTTVTDSVGSFTMDMTDLKDESCLVLVPSTTGELFDHQIISLLDSVPERYRENVPLDIYFTRPNEIVGNQKFQNYKAWASRRFENDSLRIAADTILMGTYDNKYLEYATEYMFEEDFYYEEDFTDMTRPARKVRDIITRFPGVYLHENMAKFGNVAREGAELRFIIGNNEEPESSISSCGLRYQKSLNYPLSMAESIEFIDPTIAAQHFPSKEMPKSGIIHITPKQSVLHYTTSQVQYLKLLKVNFLGKQTRLRHNNLNIRTDEPQTIYWNPECYSGSRGVLDLDLPIPSGSNATYTVKVEGVTPSGTPVSNIYRIRQ